MSDKIVHVSDATFDAEVLNSEIPVLVDFWAEWCGPCKMIAPVLDEIASEYDGKLKVCKVDVDANPDIPPKFGIRGIPTLIVFKGGNAEATKVGALSKTQLTEFIHRRPVQDPAHRIYPGSRINLPAARNPPGSSPGI
jgi:thioredoxin 1